MALTMLETDPGALIAGKYRVERVLGTGGMGVVVAALHEQLDEHVAIKLLRPDRLAQRDAVERALREARTTVKIQSDHVVRVFDVGTLDNGSPYIVMELLAGCDLAQLLCAEGRLEIADAASYVRQACDAIAKAHAIGIIHRDLKPANLFLAVRDEQSTIKVLDFGISKFTSTDSSRVDPALTKTSSLMGSPAYMSPEQLEAPRDVGASTDIWSLGVILFELLTGAHPFVADALPQLYRKISETPAPSLRDIRDDVPVDLAAIVARCLAKNPADRFPDVGALADALAPFAEDARGKHGNIALAETAIATDEQIQSARLASKISGRQTPGIAIGIDRTQLRRRRVVFGGLAFAGVAAVAASALVCVHADDEARPAPAAVVTPPSAPLADPASILACPPLVGRGVEEPSGWFGAAASGIVCARAQARMGGHSARTLVPAELVGLASVPVDKFPDDPFADIKLRDVAIAAAKARAAAWIDGEIVKDAHGLTVSLVLRVGEREIVRGKGTDRTLVAAIRSAMAPLEAAAIPKVGDPFQREWLGAKTPEAAVELVDWGIEARLEWPVKPACERILANPDITDLAKAAVRNDCSEELTDSPARDNSSAGALLLSLEADGRLGKRALVDDIGMIDHWLAQTTDHQMRAMLLAMKAQIYEGHIEVDLATKTALQAVAADPKVMAPWINGWAILSWIRAASNSAPVAIAWVPWHTEAYCFCATRIDDLELRLRYMRRNMALSTNHVWRQTLAEFLVNAGHVDEARSTIADSEQDPIMIVIEAAEGRFGRALELARTTYAPRKDVDIWNAAYALMLVGQIAFVLEKPPQDIDLFVKTYVDPAQSPLENNLVPAVAVVVACAAAPQDVGRRCLARMRELNGGMIGWTRGFLEGAERYVERDYPGAARAWRELAGHPGWQLDEAHDLVADAFARAGQDDVVERIDAKYLGVGQFNGAEYAHVRAARRAEKAGDLAAARKFAGKVIAAWSTVDLDVPAVAEMRKLVARLDRRAREHDNPR